MKKKTKGKRRGGVVLAALLSMSITMTGMPVYAEGEETVPAGEIQATADIGAGQETQKITVSISEDAEGTMAGGVAEAKQTVEKIKAHDDDEVSSAKPFSFFTIDEETGASVAWTSDRPDVLNVDGTLTPSKTENLPVKLTALVASGNYSETVEITVVVPREPDYSGDPGEVTEVQTENWTILDDSFVKTDDPNTVQVPGGNDQKLTVGSKWISFLRLDLSQAKPGHKVNKAIVVLPKVKNSGSVQFDRADSLKWWETANLTAANMPEWADAENVRYSASVTGDCEMDVTELVNEALAKGEKDLEIKIGPKNAANPLDFGSSRNTDEKKRPTFAVTYIPIPKAEDKVAQVIADIQKLDGTYVSETVGLPFEQFQNLEDGTEVTWTSDHPAIAISEDRKSGQVQVPEDANAVVNLTAAVKHTMEDNSSAEDQVTIKVTVLKKPEVSPTIKESLKRLIAYAEETLKDSVSTGEKPGTLDAEKRKALENAIADAKTALNAKTDGSYDFHCSNIIAAGKDYFSSGKISNDVKTPSAENNNNGNLLEYSEYRAKLNGLVWAAEAQLLVEPHLFTAAAKRSLQDQIDVAKKALAGETKFPYSRSREFMEARDDEAIQSAISYHTMIHNYSSRSTGYGLEPALTWYKNQNIVNGSYVTMVLSPTDATYINHYKSQAATQWGNNRADLAVGSKPTDSVTMLKFPLDRIPGSIVSAQLTLTGKQNSGAVELTQEKNNWSGDTITSDEYKKLYGDQLHADQILADFNASATTLKTDVTDAVRAQYASEEKAISFGLSATDPDGRNVIWFWGNHESVEEAKRPQLTVVVSASDDDKLQVRYDEVMKLAGDFLAGAKAGSNPGEYPEDAIKKVQEKADTLKALYESGNRSVYAVGEAMTAAENAVREARDQRILNVGEEENLFLNKRDIESIRKNTETIPEMKEIRGKVEKTADSYTTDQLKEMYNLSVEDDIDGLNKAGYKVWSQIKSMNFQSPEGTKKAYMEVRLSPEDNEKDGCGHAWLDNIEVLPTASDNVRLPNADFEKGEEGWTFVKGEKTAGKIDDAYSFGGKKSLYIENQTDQASGYWKSDEFDMPADKFELRYKGKFDDKFKGIGLSITFHFLDADGKEIGKTDPLWKNTKSTLVPDSGYMSGYQSSALMYMLTGDEDYAKRSFWYMMLFLDDHLQGVEHWLVHSGRPDGFDNYGGVQEGRNANTLATAYSLIKTADIFEGDKDLEQDFYDKINYLIRDLLDLRDRTELKVDEVAIGSDNWNTDMSIGAAMLGLAFYDKIDNAQQYVDNGKYIVQGQLNTSVRSDGSWPESIRYHVATLSKMTVFAKALRHVTGEDWFSENSAIDLSKMMRFLVNVQTPSYNGHIDVPNIGDDAMGDNTKFCVLGWYWDEVVENDPELGQQMYETWVKAGKPVGAFGGEDNILQNFFLNPDFEDEYEWNDDYTLDLGSTDYAAPYGIYQIRNNYGTGKDSYLSFVANEYGIGHCHYDQLAFTLWHNSTPLVVDPGIESYFSSSKGMYTGTTSHATVEFQNGSGQWRNLGTTSYDRSFVPGAMLDRVQGTTDFSADEKFTRTLDYGKAGQEIIVIRDQVSGALKPTRMNLPVSAEEVKVDGSRVDITGFNGTGMTVLVLEGSESLETEQIRGAGALPKKEGNASALVDIIRANGPAGNNQYLTVLLPYAGEQIQVSYEKMAAEEGLSAYKIQAGEEQYLVAANNTAEEMNCGLDTVYTKLVDGTHVEGTVALAAGEMAVLKAGIVKPEVKKDKLENALKKASELKEEDYTADAWAVFQNALPAFQAVFDDPNATQEQVDEAVRAVNAAIAELKRHPASGEEPKEVDKTILKAALDAADALNPSDYTADSWEVFQKAIEAARAVYVDENATQEQVDEAVSAVNAAVAELKKHPASGEEPKEVDKTILKAALDAADALNPSDYTADGWEVFQKAIEAARAVYADENATQEQVDEAVSAVNAAVAELKKHPVSGGNQKPGEDQKPGDAQKPGDNSSLTPGNNNNTNNDKNTNGTQTKSAPRTGDEAPIVLWLSVALAAFAAVLGSTVMRRTRKDRKKS